MKLSLPSSATAKFKFVTPPSAVEEYIFGAASEESVGLKESSPVIVPPVKGK